MKNKKIISVWNEMNPDEEIKERIFQRITVRQSCGLNEKKIHYMGRFAICAAALAVFLGSSGIVYAMVPSFREFVDSILFPRYTTTEMVAIDSGHMTGSFDERDVLLTFLDKFNQKEWGNDIKVKFENGYPYQLYQEDESSLIAFVDSEEKGIGVAVRMEKIGYEETAGIWQVQGYQVLEEQAVQAWKEKLQVYTGESSPEETQDVSPEGSVIAAAQQEILIYNAKDKENIAAVDKEDGELLISIFDSYDCGSLAFEGLSQYVVKSEEVSYLLDPGGHVVVDENDSIQGMFQLGDEDLEAVLNIFKKYGISLEEL